MIFEIVILLYYSFAIVAYFLRQYIRCSHQESWLRRHLFIMDRIVIMSK